MKNYQIVLSDKLLGEFESFKKNRPVDTSLIMRLLNMYKAPHITNIAQLKRIGVEDVPLFMQLVQNGFKDQSLEELAGKTVYKIILEDNRDDYPYVSVSDSKLKNKYTITLAPGDSRANAISHIKGLLENAVDILVYDKYMTNNWKTTKKLFYEIIPRKSLNIFYTEEHLNTKASEIKKTCSEWSVKEDKTNKAYAKLHDRYLVIDRRVEIILTSGFDYLFDSSKELTIVIGEIGS